MTSSRSLALQPATAEDVPAMTEIWFAAFTQPAIGRLFPDTPGMREWVRTWHLRNIETKPGIRYMRVVDTESWDDEGQPRIVAFACWDLATMEDSGKRFPPWHADSDKDGCDELIRGLERERTRVMGDTGHYYLDTVGTHPEYQRRGAGSMLVQWGCSLADTDGVAAYVNASKEGAFLYKKHGFVDFSPPDAEVAAMARNKTSMAE